MADKPILFSAPMILALLAGRKTQTRRVLKEQPGEYMQPDVNLDRVLICRNVAHGLRQDIRIPYAPGDRLWVREAWRTGCAYDDLKPSEMGGEEQVLYEVDGMAVRWTRGSSEPGRYRSARFMPRWASRLTLTVTNVRVQRVQEISETDAAAEGADYRTERGRAEIPGLTAKAQFEVIWDDIYGERGFGWAASPWVVALTFDVHRCNIDQMPVDSQ